MNNDSAVFTANVQQRFPFQVGRRLDVVPVRDGTRLSISLWLPEGSTEQPTGVVLEAIPYRKDDVSLLDDETRFGYLAGHGVACARLDLRGSGSSQGLLTDEYSPGEQADLLDVIDWLAAQHWCNGSVGMTGISWSGFNALQMAARGPVALKAIITACASDDRYDNDVHYLGGAPLAFYMNLWGSALHLMSMRPPMPSVIGDEWLSEWRSRLSSNPDFTSLWLSHQQRDAYWRQGSVCEDYDAIKCPVLLVGGWGDNYTDSIFRLLDNLPGNAQAIIGPWGHTWPERPEPGPGIDFLRRSLDWWEHWLNGVDNGVPDQPRCCFYVQDYTFSREDLDVRPGKWWAVDDPNSVVTPRMLSLSDSGELDLEAAHDTTLESTSTISDRAIVGTAARHLLPMGVSTDLPGIQDTDDERSLTFDSAPIKEDMAILGRVLVCVRAASNAPTGHLFVRLTDVDADDHSHLVARGALNLTHRRGHAPRDVQPLQPGVFETYVIPMKATSYRFPAGHRIRVSVSSTYWPWLWPAPDRSVLEIRLGESSVTLPMLDEGSAQLVAIDLGGPVIAPPPDVEVAGDALPYWYEERGGDGTVNVFRGTRGTSRLTLADGWTVENRADDTVYSIREGDPLSAAMYRHLAQAFRWSGHDVEIDFTTSMTCDYNTYSIGNQAEITLDGSLVFRENTTNVIPREL